MMLEAALGLPRAPHWGGLPQSSSQGTPSGPCPEEVQGLGVWKVNAPTDASTQVQWDCRLHPQPRPTEPGPPGLGDTPRGRLQTPVLEPGSGPHVAALPEAPAHVPKGPESAGWVGGQQSLA